MPVERLNARAMRLTRRDGVFMQTPSGVHKP
jgi:hypothetical protein